MAGVLVDFVPSGPIEAPPGTTTMPGRQEEFDVFAFDEVFTNAMQVLLPGGGHIKLPTPQGYTALKLKAWCDRSARFEYKDAEDLAIACHWHTLDDSVIDELWDTERGHRLLVASDMSVDRAVVKLLGLRVATEIGVIRTSELRTAWRRTDERLLASHFASTVVDGIRLHSTKSALRAVEDLSEFMAIPPNQLSDPVLF